MNDIMDRARLVAENPDVLRCTVARIVNENGQPIGHWVKVARDAEINGVRPLKCRCMAPDTWFAIRNTGEIVDIASLRHIRRLLVGAPWRSRASRMWMSW